MPSSSSPRRTHHFDVVRQRRRLVGGRADGSSWSGWHIARLPDLTAVRCGRRLTSPLATIQFSCKPRDRRRAHDRQAANRPTHSARFGRGGHARRRPRAWRECRRRRRRRDRALDAGLRQQHRRHGRGRHRSGMRQGRAAEYQGQADLLVCRAEPGIAADRQDHVRPVLGGVRQDLSEHHRRARSLDYNQMLDKLRTAALGNAAPIGGAADAAVEPGIRRQGHAARARGRRMSATRRRNSGRAP